MKLSEKFLLGFVAACLIVFPPFAHAQNAPAPDVSYQKDHEGKHIQEIYRQLNLTDDQKSQLDDIKQKHRAAMAQARQAMKANKEALQQELMKLQLDMPKINTIEAKIKVLQAQLEDDRLGSILAVRAVLTPDQFFKFINLMHKHKDGHDEGADHPDHE